MKNRNVPMVDPVAGTAGRPVRALVAFSGRTELKWLRLLRAGFRHCFVLVETSHADGAAWLLYNPLSTGTQVALWPAADESAVRAWLAAEGYRVVPAQVQPLGARSLGWRPYTCVEAVKRVLGLRAPGVMTPWQLYRYIEKNPKYRKKSLTFPSN